MEYTVKTLAELAGITPRTLRWYDKLGLLRPCRVTQAGRRLARFYRNAVAAFAEKCKG